jgi:quercetin dioxygenase-like cupin family protein
MSIYDWDTIEPEEISNFYQRKIAVGDSLTVAQVEVREGAVTLPHKHENEEVIIVLHGRWRFSLPGGDVTLADNQMLAIPAGVEHSSEALADTLALDVCSATRTDWLTGEDQPLHYDPEQSLWGV